MREILTVEQAKQIAADIQVWIGQHAAANIGPLLDSDTPEVIAARQKRWQEAKLLEFEQLAEINEFECFFVVLQMGGPQWSIVRFVLVRQKDGTMRQVMGYSFRMPNFIHSAQKDTHHV